MMVDKDKLIEDLQAHLGKDETGKLLSKLKDMHTKGSSTAELQEEIIKALNEIGVEAKGVLGVVTPTALPVSVVQI